MSTRRRPGFNSPKAPRSSDEVRLMRIQYTNSGELHINHTHKSRGTRNCNEYKEHPYAHQQSVSLSESTTSLINSRGLPEIPATGGTAFTNSQISTFCITETCGSTLPDFPFWTFPISLTLCVHSPNPTSVAQPDIEMIFCPWHCSHMSRIQLYWMPIRTTWTT